MTYDDKSGATKRYVGHPLVTRPAEYSLVMRDT
jgi:hypothetical protein